jgi:hypothetical protein
VELEGLITAYEIMPPDLYTTRYMDNTQAIAIHDRLKYGLPTPRKLMRMHYRQLSSCNVFILMCFVTDLYVV